MIRKLVKEMRKTRIAPFNQSVHIPNSIGRKLVLSEYINDYLPSSSIYFIGNMFKSESIFSRVVWTLYILASITACSYYFVLNILDFLNYDTITRIDQVYENEVEFPAVSLCSAYLNDTSFEMNILKLNFNLLSLINQTSQWQDYFEHFNDSMYNQCYRFNSGKSIMSNSTPILQSSFPGSSYGLQLEFYFETNNPDFGQLAILIHNHTMPPFTLYDNADIISAGCIYYYPVQRTLDEDLPLPYNNCLKDMSQFPLNKTIINYIQNKNRQYSQVDCFYLCQSLKFNKENNCGCTFEDLNDFLPKCSTSDGDECAYIFLSNLLSRDQFELCADYCPLECDSYSLDFVQKVQPILVANNTLSDQFIYPQFKTFANFSRNFYSINVFYKKLKYMNIVQIPKLELFGLISNLGGLLGLFLGLSFISLVEILQLTFNLIKKIISNCFLPD